MYIGNWSLSFLNWTNGSTFRASTSACIYRALSRGGGGGDRHPRAMRLQQASAEIAQFCAARARPHSKGYKT